MRRPPLQLPAVVFSAGRFTPTQADASRAQNPVTANPEESILKGVGDVMSYPQRRMVEAITGTYQDPSAALGIQNPIAGFATDMVLDPTNAIPAGALAKMFGRGAKVAGAADEVIDAGRGVANAVERGPRMSALHNISKNKLESVLNLGGLPVPSIAVVPENIPFNEFGPITFIGRKSLGDPQINPVYSDDIWSSMVPQPHVAPPDPGKFADRWQQLLGVDVPDHKVINVDESGWTRTEVTTQDPFIRHFLSGRTDIALHNPEDSQALLQHYINTNDIPRLSYDNEQNLRYLRGIATHSNVNMDLNDFKSLVSNVIYPEDLPRTDILNSLFMSNLMKADMQNWAKQNFADLIPEPELVVDGVRKPFNLQTVTEQMTKQIVGSGSSDGIVNNIPMYRAGTAIASRAKRFADIEEMRAASSKITSESTKYALPDVLDKLPGYSGVKPWDDEYHNTLVNAYKAITTSTDETLDAALKNEGFTNLPVTFIDEIKDALKRDTAQTNYFEAKPQRAVKFDEFAGAIVPEDLPDELFNRLKNIGLTVEKYDNNNRFDTLNSLRRRLNDQGMETLFTPAGFGLGAGAAMYGQTKER
jgi:hypothetical protein